MIARSTLVRNPAIPLQIMTASPVSGIRQIGQQEQALRQLAVILWATALLAVLVRVGIWPLRANSVYDVYVIAARHWLKGVAVYSWGTGSGYRYSPMIAILFAPFTLLPDRVGGIVWRALCAGIFLGGLGWCCKLAIPSRRVGRAWPIVFMLVLPLAAGSINNAQANCLLAGLLLCGIAATYRRRWNLAAACVTLACFFKIYPLSVLLLLCVLFPRKLAIRFAGMLAAGLLVPFLFDSPAAAFHLYAEWIRRLAIEDRAGLPLRQWFQDVRLLFGVWGYPLGATTFMIVQLLAAAAIAAICLIGKARRWPQRLLLARMLTLACCWMTVLGPSTEFSTYILLAPGLAWAICVAWSDPKASLDRLVLFSSYILFLSVIVGFWFPFGRTYSATGVAPLAGVLFMVHAFHKCIAAPRIARVFGIGRNLADKQPRITSPSPARTHRGRSVAPLGHLPY